MAKTRRTGPDRRPFEHIQDVLLPSTVSLNLIQLRIDIMQHMLPGVFVLLKTADLREYFWVKVHRTRGTVLKGHVASELYFTDWPFGKAVSFAVDRIHDFTAAEA
tara:strand:+ start:2166 stop:2480 length:315 start_codon:yes stop_codon:yes gene_type:complete